MIKNIFSKKWVNLGVVIAVLSLVILFSNTVKSSPLDNLKGFAWGADLGAGQTGQGGLGWLSFNCTNPGSNCATSNYGVTIKPDGDLVGYAWSPHYGWLRFGGFDVGTFPIGGGYSENAKIIDVVGAPDQVVGWARFCAGAANPNCTGTVPNSSNGGWDGWVSLSGTTSSGDIYGVLLNDESELPGGGFSFSSYAWGGNSDELGNNTVGVGWINFDTDFSEVVYEPVDDATVTLSASLYFVPEGGTTTLTWTGVGLVDSPTGCIASGGATESTPGTPNPPWTGTAVSPSGSYTTGALTTGALNETGTYTYTITCEPEAQGGENAVASVEVIVGIVLDLSATPSVAFPDDSTPPVYTTTLDWKVFPPTAQLTNCVPTDDAGPSDPTGWEVYNVGDIPPIGSTLVTVPNNPTKFKLKCETSSPGIFAEDEVPVPQGSITESVILKNVGCVDPIVHTTTLAWELVNIDPNQSCTAVAEVFDTNWEGPVSPVNGSEPGIIVFAEPPATHSYQLICTGAQSHNLIASDPLLLNWSSCTTSSGKPYYVEN